MWHNTSFNGYEYLEETILFWQKVLFLITENEVVLLANEPTLSIENKNQLFVRIILSINPIENILIENIEFFKNYVEISTIYVAICRQNPYRSCKKVTDHPL